MQEENIQKLPTFKAFFDGELIGTQFGVKLDLIEALLIDLNTRLAPKGAGATIDDAKAKKEGLTQQQGPQPQQSKSVPAAHPALAVKNDDSILKGSSTRPELTALPQEVIDFKESLDSHAVVIFSLAPSTVPSTPSSRPQINSTQQLLNDMDLLRDRFSNNNVQVQIKHVVIANDDKDHLSNVMQFEYGLDKITAGPIIKMFYKQIVFATIYNGNAYDVEAKLPDLVQL